MNNQSFFDDTFELISSKVKMLELSNAVDEWEQNYLFSENGFYSLKGNEPNGEINEYFTELQNFVDEKFLEIKSNSPYCVEALQALKKEKTESIKNEMLEYQNSEYENYVREVGENAVSLSINRAVLHKNNPQVVEKCFQYGAAALNLLYCNKSSYSDTLAIYKSDFYSALINAFAKDNDITAFHMYEKHKNELTEEKVKAFENVIKELRVNVIAANYAKELFSDSLTREQIEKDVNTIKDEQIKKAVKKYLMFFEKDAETAKKNDEKNKNMQNWQNIIDGLRSGRDNVYSLIDYSLNDESVKLKKVYINNVGKNGFVKTDIDKYIELIELFMSGYEDYINKDIYNYIAYLSLFDFKNFEEFQKMSNEEYTVLNSDFALIKNILTDVSDKGKNTFYEFVRLYLIAFREYKTANKKNPDLDTRNKIISGLKERFFSEKKSKSENGEKEQSLKAQNKPEDNDNTELK